MQLLKAFSAFYHILFYRECEHKRVISKPGDSASPSYCPDCGYKVHLLWTLCRCRTCGSKRLPKMGADGRISSLYRYCQHCGQADYQIIKKEKINVHEMPYAILLKDIDYTEERQPKPQKPYNPFRTTHRLDIVDGEVLQKTEQLYSKGQARI